MEKNEYFTRFQEMCIGILAQSGNCEESQAFFHNAHTVPELVSAWKRYWDGFLHEVPSLVMEAFRKNYDIYREDINLAGVFYNEVPPLSAPPSIILVGDDDADGETPSPALVVDGRHRVYVFGARKVWTKGACNVFVNAEKACVRLSDACRANVEKGKVVAMDRTVVSGKGNIVCYGSVTVKLFGGSVEDYGHLLIDAYNDSRVISFTERKINLHDNAKIFPI
ncbi:hypothetical protein PvtlMGM1_1733 [Prevotella sp. MGM1]|nr:hypothetical protein PvtlMGM1_1733 [Prevotella sp. MGM1]